MDPHGQVVHLRSWAEFERDHFPITVQRWYPQPPSALHTHDYFEIVVIQRGRGTHVTEGEEYTVTAGDVFVIGGQRSHLYCDAEDLWLVDIMYFPDKVILPARDLRTLAGYHALFTLEPTYRKLHSFESRLRLSILDLGTVNRLIDILEKELVEKVPGYTVMATTFFLQLVTTLSRMYDQAPDLPSRELLRLGKAISFLEQNYQNRITVEEVAEVAHMSVRNFQRVFHKVFGVSVIDYLIRLRVSHAAYLLQQRDKSVTQIAFEVGFQESSYFSRQFRRFMGVNPKDYRGSAHGNIVSAYDTLLPRPREGVVSD